MTWLLALERENIVEFGCTVSTRLYLWYIWYTRVYLSTARVCNAPPVALHFVSRGAEQQQAAHVERFKLKREETRKRTHTNGLQRSPQLLLNCNAHDSHNSAGTADAMRHHPKPPSPSQRHRSTTALSSSAVESPPANNAPPSCSAPTA